MPHETTILIVEDEDRILTLIKSLIDWDDLHLKLAGACQDGAHALELLRREPVDIVITDIRMPGINGLELAQWIGDNMPDIAVIIISGYKQFDYAQSAIRIGVAEFLLKPIKKKEINLAISKILDRRSLDGNTPKSSTVSEDYRDSLRRQWMQRLLYGSVIADVPIEEFNKVNAFHFYPGEFAAITVFIYPQSPDISVSLELTCVEQQTPVSSSFSFKLRDLLIAGLVSKVYDVEAAFSGDTIFCLVNFDNKERKTFEQALKNSTELINEHADMLKLRASVFVSNYFQSLSAFSRALVEVKSIFPCKCVSGQPNPFFARSLPAHRLHLPSLGFERTVSKAVETRNFDELLVYLHQCFDDNRQLLLKDPRLITDFLQQVFSALWVSVPKHAQLTAETMRILQNNLIVCSQDLQDLREYYCLVILSIMKEITKEAVSTLSLPIHKVKQFIQLHYMEQITLQQLSETSEWSETYLCSVFKQETGENISSYIQKIRIEKAKQLLTSTAMQMAEIAVSVGYQDQRYFSRMFRKRVGIRPTDYRHLNI